jgi:predicted nucleic acid-binding Zn ribbon protein
MTVERGVSPFAIAVHVTSCHIPNPPSFLLASNETRIMFKEKKRKKREERDLLLVIAQE